MDAWPETPGADTFAVPEGRQAHRLDVFLTDGRLTDVHLDGESVHPTWFKNARQSGNRILVPRLADRA